MYTNPNTHPKVNRHLNSILHPHPYPNPHLFLHEGMLTARKHCNAHTAYAKFRSALELLETFGLMTPPPPTDEAEMDVSSGAKVVSEELTQHHKFVQELESGYITFLEGYQQVLGIAPVVNTDKHTKSIDDMTLEDDSVSHATTTASAIDLEVEVGRLQREIATLQQENTSQQRAITSQQREITTLHQEYTAQQHAITSQQREITSLHQQNNSQQREIEQIRLQLEEFMKTSQASN